MIYLQFSDGLLLSLRKVSILLKLHTNLPQYRVGSVKFRRVETVTKNFVDKIERDPGIPPSLDENEIREYFKMIIKEKKE